MAGNCLPGPTPHLQRSVWDPVPGRRLARARTDNDNDNDDVDIDWLNLSLLRSRRVYDLK